MSVSQARQAARHALVEMASGVNPNQAKAEKRAQGITLSDAIEQVLSEKSSVLKKTTIGDYRKVLLRHFIDWGEQAHWPDYDPRYYQTIHSNQRGHQKAIKGNQSHYQSYGGS